MQFAVLRLCVLAWAKKAEIDLESGISCPSDPVSKFEAVSSSVYSPDDEKKRPTKVMNDEILDFALCPASRGRL